MPPKPPDLAGLIQAIESDLLAFLLHVGQTTGRNAVRTQINALLQLYAPITQEQLQTMTHLAASTVSATLAGMLDIKLIRRDLQPHSRQYHYSPASGQFSFEYTPFSVLLEKLTEMDKYCEEVSSDIAKRIEIPQEERETIVFRINSVRNYIELQRRALVPGYRPQASFYVEQSRRHSAKRTRVLYGDLLQAEEKKIVEILTKSGIFSENSPTESLIFAYCITRPDFTQDELVRATEYSLSTISRAIASFVRKGIIFAEPKGYQQPRLYFMPSLCRFLGQAILTADRYIFSFRDKFQDHLRNTQTILKSNAHKSNEETGARIAELGSKLEKLLTAIDDLAKTSAIFEENFELYSKEFFES